MPRNEGEISHQKALAGKREGIRQFPSELCDHIRNEARNENIVVINMEKNSAVILSFNYAKNTSNFLTVFDFLSFTEQ